MSQKSVERALGKLITDEMFRREFFADPARAVRAAGLDLLPDELQALRRAPRKMLMALEAKLEDRICRLAIPEWPSREEDRDEG